MTAPEYKAIRQRIGTQREAAPLLGVHMRTLSKRERGVTPITLEAETTIRCVLARIEREVGT